MNSRSLFAWQPRVPRWMSDRNSVRTRIGAAARASLGLLAMFIASRQGFYQSTPHSSQASLICDGHRIAAPFKVFAGPGCDKEHGQERIAEHPDEKRSPGKVPSGHTGSRSFEPVPER